MSDDYLSVITMKCMGGCLCRSKETTFMYSLVSQLSTNIVLLKGKLAPSLNEGFFL